jgi:hypothetical protein
MIAHNNDTGFLTHFGDLLAALRHVQLKAQVIVIDNSDTDRLCDAVIGNETPGFKRIAADYHWHGGANLLYGPSMNEAVSVAIHPYLLYVCANHGESRDPTWPLDLLAPLAEDRVAMTGSLQFSGEECLEELGFPPEIPAIHIQGGIFAARTDVLRAYPYPNGKCAHWFSDIYQCARLLAEGWKLVDVPTIKSVWREDPGEGEWKYVHRGGV